MSAYLDKGVRAVILWTLATVPLLFGARHPLVHGTYAAFLLLVCGSWLVFRYRHVSLRASTFWLPLALIGLVACTALVLPEPVLTLITPIRATSLAAVRDLAGVGPVTSISYYAPRSFFYALYGLGVLLYFHATVHALISRRFLHHFLWLVTVVGLFEAVYGLVQVLDPSIGPLWLAEDIAPGSAKGTIIYRNQYALFLNLCWPLAVALGLSLYDPEEYRNSRNQQGRMAPALAALLSLAFHKGAVPFWSAAFMILAVLFSQSRGGIVTLSLVILLYTWLLPLRKRIKCTFFVLLAVFLLGYGSILGYTDILSRFEQFANGAQGRFELWLASLSMFRDHLLTGIGMGGYEYISTVYLEGVPDSVWFDRAHNEYLELLIELGLPLMGVVLFWMGRSLIRQWRLMALIRRDKKSILNMEPLDLAAIGAFSALCAFFLHPFVDFVWRLPANIVYGVTLLAILQATQKGYPVPWRTKRSHR
ncbi:MAG: O-antigen ligase family protein [Desulfobulbaceae bacterium]|uniref:O-antigen ligase family protein n=1 Tax=Candidatus Desulfatifera sulfidica TaxID=2841691 RepID=A0A8J6N9A8_9BACT|nr:O-antigen ligase family protein [Candidatus Desulfatifera sulfidica]